MISHQTLYTIANTLGMFAMLTVVGYHIIAVNTRYVEQKKQH